MATVLLTACNLAAVQKKPVRLRSLLLMLYFAATAAATMQRMPLDPCNWPGTAPAARDTAAVMYTDPERTAHCQEQSLHSSCSGDVRCANQL